jgi:predicted metalloprotease with PDZ domain
MRRLWRNWGARGKPYPSGEIERLASAAAGRSLASFFDRFVRGVETPPFERLLPAFGLVLKEKPEAEDGVTPSRARLRADFGWKTKDEKGRLAVAEVYAGRAAYEAGVSAGDELVAVAGVKADEDALKRVERDGKPGSRVDVALFRRKRLLTVPVVLGARRDVLLEVRADRTAKRAARRMAARWLKRPISGLS